MPGGLNLGYQKFEDRMFLNYNRKLTPNAKSLRKNMTPEERKLWYGYLSKYPIRILRQRVIDNYIVDFYCSKAKLVIEIDGSQHYTVEGMVYDRLREEVLKCYQLKVMRITNKEVRDNFYGVCLLIDHEVKSCLKGVNDVMTTNRTLKIGSRYRHFKGNEYLVLHLAKHSETLEEYVVYQALYGERGIWIRPLEMFLDQKEVNGQWVNRFEEIVESN